MPDVVRSIAAVADRVATTADVCAHEASRHNAGRKIFMSLSASLGHHLT
jgi:hypothetical protein